jgi:hypothetical protein
MIGPHNILPVHQREPPIIAVENSDVEAGKEPWIKRTGIEVIQIDTHIINWKKTPSPRSIPFTKTKFEPKEMIATNAAV